MFTVELVEKKVTELTGKEGFAIYHDVAGLFAQLHEAASLDELDETLDSTGTVELESLLIQIMHTIMIVQDDELTTGACKDLLAWCKNPK